MVTRMMKLSQVLTVLDASRKHDDWIAAHQQQGYSEKDRAALFAALQKAEARKRNALAA
jgi:hypothetical protein